MDHTNINTSAWVFYDFLMVQGGAEYTTLLLQKALNANVCVASIAKDSFNSIDHRHVLTIGHHWKLPVIPTVHGLWCFYKKTFFLNKFTGPVIFSGNNAVCAVHNHPNGQNILYCHTIPRFAFDLYDYYKDRLPFWQKPIYDALCILVRRTYLSSLRKMDTILVNSKNVKQRMKKYTGYDSDVVYPPVETEKYTYIKTGDFYLSTARLEDYKRVDLIIKAFRKMPDKRLVIASSGRQAEHLKDLARGATNITFTGWIKDAELKKLVGESLATLYMPIDEDFGISPVESMAAGTPVIGVNEGGVLETVEHEKTGYLCPPTEKDIMAAVIYMTREKALSMRKRCEERAKNFDKSVFVSTVRKYLREPNQDLSTCDL